MDKELEETIEILKAEKSKLYGLCQTKNRVSSIEEARATRQAIETVLTVLENSILKQVGGRRNGKEIQNAINLYNQMKKLPSCKLFGIKNCEGKAILLTKNECIPKQVIEEKIETYKRLELESFNKYSIKADEYRAIIQVLQELLEGK